jgi:hypothetical protein
MVDRISRQVEHDRGITITRYSTFNDISEFMPVPDGAATNGGESATDATAAGRALAQTRFAQLPAPGAEEQLMLLFLQQVDGELIMGTTSRDANRVPLRELETLLRGTESLLVAAALGDVELSRLAEITGVEPVVRGPGWLRVGPSWVEFAEARRLVEDALPAPAAVFAVPEPARAHGPGDSTRQTTDRAGQPADHTLVAYLTAGDGIGTPEQAHAACMTTLAGTRSLAPPGGIRYTAMAPHQYVICANAPADVRDQAAWRRQTVVAEGDGRQGR